MKLYEHSIRVNNILNWIQIEFYTEKQDIKDGFPNFQ